MSDAIKGLALKLYDRFNNQRKKAKPAGISQDSSHILESVKTEPPVSNNQRSIKSVLDLELDNWGKPEKKVKNKSKSPRAKLQDSLSPRDYVTGKPSIKHRVR